MADPQNICFFDREPNYSFRRFNRHAISQYRAPMYSSSRYYKERPMQRSMLNNRRVKFSKQYYYDDGDAYLQHKNMRYGSCMTGSMFEDEEEYHHEYARRESERAYKKLKREVEQEPDEYTKTMMEITLMEMKMEHLKYEIDGLKDEHRDLKHENYYLRQEIDELGIDEEYVPPTKKARSPNVPFVKAGHRKHKKKSDQGQYANEHPFSNDGFQFDNEPSCSSNYNNPESYDYDAFLDYSL